MILKIKTKSPTLKKKKKRIHLAMQRTPVLTLVRELRSHVLRGS